MIIVVGWAVNSLYAMLVSGNKIRIEPMHANVKVSLTMREVIHSKMADKS